MEINTMKQGMASFLSCRNSVGIVLSCIIYTVLTTGGYTFAQEEEGKKKKADVGVIASQSSRSAFPHMPGSRTDSVLATDGDSLAQEEEDGKKKTDVGVIASRSSRSAFPQMSGSRAAYTDSLSMPLAAAKKRATQAVANSHKEAPSSKGPTLMIRDVAFAGNSVFSKEILRAVIYEDLGKKLSFGQIRAMAGKIEEFYHQNGYQIAKVMIPKQDMKPGGPLKIQILEGRLGKVAVSGNKRYSSERVTDVFYAHNEPDKPFTMCDIESPLVLLNSYSGISVSSTLAPGAHTGQTDVEIEVKEEARIKGSLEFNNFGSDDSGEYRIIPHLALPNFTGAGDELSVFGVISPDSSDSWYWQTGYVRPIGVRGTSVSAYYGRGHNQVGNDYSVLDIKGKNSSWGLGLTHRVICSARTSLDLHAWFEWQDMDQSMLGFRTIDDQVRKLRIGANYDRTDSSGRTFVSFNIHQGLGELFGGMDNNDPYSSRAFAKADNRFTKTVLGLMRLQSFNPRFYGILNITGQCSLDPLVSGEQIYAGGATTVRGQPVSYYMGDSGVLLNAELRFAVLPDTSRLQLAAFFDHARTNIKRPIVGQRKWSSLSGAGVGVRAEVFDSLDLRVDVAVPVGTNRGDSCYLYGQIRYDF